MSILDNYWQVIKVVFHVIVFMITPTNRDVTDESLSCDSLSRTKVLIVPQSCQICIRHDARLKKFFRTRWSLTEHILRNHKQDRHDAIIELQKLGYTPKNWIGNHE